MAKADTSMVISHWYNLMENLQASPKEFYASVEESIQKRQVPNIKISHVDWKEGGILSAKREYLRIKRNENIFDICGAHFGNGFFVSWWLCGIPSGFLYLLTRIPIIGLFIEWFIKPDTYYKMDTALMFQQSIHAAVMEAVDGLTQAKGLRALSELERKPIMREFHGR